MASKTGKINGRERERERERDRETTRPIGLSVLNRVSFIIQTAPYIVYDKSQITPQGGSTVAV